MSARARLSGQTVAYGKRSVPFTPPTREVASAVPLATPPTKEVA
jgi:hypothetical protein